MNSGKQSKVYSHGINAESRKRLLKTGGKALWQFYSLLLHPLPGWSADDLADGSLYFQCGALGPSSRGSTADLTCKFLCLSVLICLRATWGADYKALIFVLPNSESTQGWKIAGTAQKHCKAMKSPQRTGAKTMTETYDRLPKAKEEKPRRNLGKLGHSKVPRYTGELRKPCMCLGQATCSTKPWEYLKLSPLANCSLDASNK